MAVFKMLVGLPASGKSSFAKELEDKGYLLFSSDSLRESTGEKNNSKVFEALHTEILKELRNGKDCVLDAMNIGRKKRTAFLERVKAVGAETHCELFIIPVSILKERNRIRGNNHGVDDDVIDQKVRGFECPWYSDGFDRINIHYYDGEFDLGYDKASLMEMDQDNPHHTLTVGRHEEKAYRYIEKKYIFTEHFPFLLEAIKYHDDGKYFTKVYHNMKGEPTETAHYYGHENVGAYLFLLRGFCLGQFEEAGEYPLTDWGILYVANLINWHMRPLNAWSKSKKAEDRDRNRIGEEMYRDILALRDADVYAK